VSLVQLDLRESAAVRELVHRVRPDCAIHLAWYAVPGKFWTSERNLDCTAMSLDLAKHLAEVGCSRLVAAGSCAEYDWDYGFLSEDVTPIRPRTLYGVCKNATRQVLQAYSDRVPLSFAWTRFFYLYGPGEAEARLVPSVISALLSGHQPKCTEGSQIRDFLHVEDVASAIWAVAQSDITGPVNIASGEPVSIRSVAENLERLVTGARKVLFGALPSDPAEPPVLLADVRKLKRHTAWVPSHKLEDGLRQSINWWQENPRFSEGLA
jgi:nucleoside-diphosphate-sugar epimerase